MLPYPNLDDRDFNQLMASAADLVSRRCPAWTDLTPNDPGITLIEAFAHLTEVMLYRLNRVPEKVHIALLNLLGVRLQPPAPARVELRFSIEEATEEAVDIPLGTLVSSTDTADDAPVFRTMAAASIAPGELETTVVAINADLVEAQLVGEGTGLGGQIVRLPSAPVTTTGLAPFDDAGEYSTGDSLATSSSKGRAISCGTQHRRFEWMRLLDRSCPTRLRGSSNSLRSIMATRPALRCRESEGQSARGTGPAVGPTATSIPGFSRD